MIELDEMEYAASLESDEERFLYIERVARERLGERSIGGGTRWSAEDYMNVVLATAEECGIADLTGFEMPDEHEDRQETYQRFKLAAQRAVVKLGLRRGKPAMLVALDAKAKETIKHCIDQIREHVQNSELSPERKDRLTKLLSELQFEVDRERTPVRAVTELWLGLCTAGGQGGKKLLSPVTPFIERIGTAIGIARGNVQISLPPPPKRIEDKRGGRGFDRALDEEIPF